MNLRRSNWLGLALLGFMTLVLNLQGQSIEHFRTGFLSPPIEYHTVPSWWWDGGDLVTIERISWQLEQLKSQGTDVVCLIHHVPFNLRPKYQTEEWWKLVRQMVEKAASLEMKVWITDGIAWGSPLINNIVVEEDPSFVGQILDHLETSTRKEGRFALEIPRGTKILEILGAYAYPSEKGVIDVEGAKDLSNFMQGRKLTWEAPAGEWTVMLFYSKPGFYQEGGDYQSFIGPGRGEPLDYMNPKAMERLFDVTLGEYERNLGEHLGTTVTATFQDELLTSQGFPAISPHLFAAFRDLKGYDLLPSLGAFYRDAGRVTPKVRCDYHDVRTHLLEEAFFKPEYQWYEDHGMMIAHDQFGRGSLIGQIYQYGDYFRTMRWYQAPGLDDWHEARAGRNLRDIKMAASIAHLYERPRVFSEALHTAGWGLTMEQQLQVVNEEYVMGINLYDEVLFNYSTHGSWFEWAPAATMFRQPYFRHKRLFNDYVNRLSYIMSQGKHVADVAVIYPVTSLQANIGGSGANQKASLISASFYQLSERLFYDGIDFDVIDEGSIQRSVIDEGRLEVAGESFRILVLPTLTALKRDTLSKIRHFYENGGMVIAGTLLPLDSPEAGAKDDQNIRDLQLIFGFSPEQANEGTAAGSHNRNRKGGRSYFLPEGLGDVTEVIRANFQVDVDTEIPGVYAHHRRIADQDFFLLYNSSDKPVSGWVRVRAKGQPEVWNSEIGAVQRIHTFQEEDTYTALELVFAPYEAHLVALAGNIPGSLFQAADLIDVSLSNRDQSLSVTGRTSSPGKMDVKAFSEGRDYKGSVHVPDLPAQILVGNRWRFSVEPTLDNQWGDFRLPVTEEDRIIGPEIREFLHRQEDENEDGETLGWAAADFAAADWEKTVYTVGPYWWIISTFHTRGGPAMLDEVFIPETRIDVAETYQYGNETLRWRPYSFSQQFGIHKDIDYYRSFGVGHYVNVNSNYLDLGPVEAFSIGYAYTNVFSPTDMKAFLKTNAGGYMEPFKVWVNNEVVSERFLMGPIGNIPVSLKKGWNEVLLKVMQFPLLNPKHMRFFFHLQPEDEVLGRESSAPAGRLGGPRLQWFSRESPFTYDLRPGLSKRVGWYRFSLPPGTAEFRLDLFGKARAFVDGSEITVSEEGKVRLPKPTGEGSVCSLRVEQERGRYAGAAFRSPVRLELTEGITRLGDWSKKGLYSFSGVGVYTTDVEVPVTDKDVHWELNLGEVRTSAEVSINGTKLGARAWSPYRFEVGHLLRAGKNTIQVKVANTLANHGLIGTAWMFIYEGNERSGLIGPVVLRPTRKVSIQWDVPESISR